MDNYYEILRVLDSKYSNQIHGVKNIVAKYISEVGFSLEDINCQVDENGLPKIMLSNGSEISFQSQNNGLLQIAIKKENEKAKIWTVIDYPPNPSVAPYTESDLPYTPRIDSYCIDESGIYYTSYSPYIKRNNETSYNQTEPLRTLYYGTETLESNSVSKTFENISMKLETIEPDASFETEISYALVYSPDGSQTLDFNIIQAATNVEKTFSQEKTQGHKM